MELIQKVIGSENITVTGASIASSNLQFNCEASELIINNPTVQIDCKTAGSIMLLIQASLPVLLYSKSAVDRVTIDLHGGTHATMAPTAEDYTHVLFPLLHKHFGMPVDAIDLNVIKR